MIRSFADREAALIWSGGMSRRLPRDIQVTALRKLRHMNRVARLEDLAEPPGIDWKRSPVIDGDSIQSGSTGSGGSVSAGPTEAVTMSISATITDVGDPADWLPNPTPGDILLEDFLKPIGMSQNALARAIGVPPRRINEIILGKRSMTADTDLRLARYWGMTPGFFLGLQMDYDLLEQRRKMGAELEKITPRAA